jgi:hypothetical protein
MNPRAIRRRKPRPGVSRSVVHAMPNDVTQAPAHATRMFARESNSGPFGISCLLVVTSRPYGIEYSLWHKICVPMDLRVRSGIGGQGPGASLECSGIEPEHECTRGRNRKKGGTGCRGVLRASRRCPRVPDRRGFGEGLILAQGEAARRVDSLWVPAVCPTGRSSHCQAPEMRRSVSVF